MPRIVKTGIFILIVVFCFTAFAASRWDGPPKDDRMGDDVKSQKGGAPDPEPEKKETPLHKGEASYEEDDILVEKESRYLGTSHGSDE
jgi:hypothetical protein